MVSSRLKLVSGTTSTSSVIHFVERRGLLVVYLGDRDSQGRFFYNTKRKKGSRICCLRTWSIVKKIEMCVLQEETIARNILQIEEGSGILF